LGLFEQQLPDAMELLARSLRAGHSLTEGMHLIGEEMPAPSGPEFGRCFEQQNLGVSLEDALEEMTHRIPSVDLRFFATAMVLQRQTGGDAAEILDKIGRLIRQRFQLRGQVAALTGEGRLSGVVLLSMPFVLAVYMYLRDPKYLSVLFTDPIGQKMLVGGIVAQILGAIAVKKIVDIRV
jgi:tight adherence protein B